MQVFISWSGEPSQTFAKVLAEWLPTVIQSVKPFLSSNDIRAGQRWLGEIGKRLQDTKFGILCLTPKNKEAPWVLFEAGALSKTLDDSHVVPLLIGMDKAQLTLSPLTQFQAVLATREEIGKLLQSMNALSASPLEERRLISSFDAFWPHLEAAIKRAEGEIGAPE